MIRILYLPVGEPAETREIEPTLQTFQQLVGGLIEAIRGEDWTAYLNEEGKLDGLPANAFADRLAAVLGWEGLPGDVLVGPVVFCGPVDDKGEDTSVTQRVLDHAMELHAEEAGDVE